MSILFRNLLYFQILLFASVGAVSAPPFPFEVEQTNGEKIPVRLFGHEYYNWMETEDGYVLDWVEDDLHQGWFYSKLDKNGKFVASEIFVTFPAPDGLEIQKHLREISPKVRTLNYQNINRKSHTNDHLQRGIVDNTLKPLVLLVEFDNERHTYSAQNFSQLLFADNLSPADADFPSTHNDYTMSVRDYYDEISNGKQEISGGEASVVNWETANNDYSYYVDGANGTGSGENGVAQSAAALIVEIAMKIDEEGFDFSQFDNGAGAIDVVVLIVAGKGGNKASNYFWPHMFVVPQSGGGLEDINPNAPSNSSGYFSPGSNDGVAIYKYIVIQEKYAWNHSGTGIGFIHPIGTICHELGHVLGLPDLYDTSEYSAAGIGEWGLMGSGNYQRQTSPAYLGAWSRYRLGFIDPTIIDTTINGDEILLPAAYGGIEYTAMILPMSNHMSTEYLLLENRQQYGADQHLEKSGLLVWHIDETITDMYPAMNSVNVNPEFYGVNLIQADGFDHLYGNCNQCEADEGDPFPGDFGVSTLNNLSTYSYDRDADGDIELGNDSGIEITNIVEDEGSNISFTVLNPNVNGEIVGYDEGGYDGVAFADGGSIEWAGIRFISPGEVQLSGIKTVFQSSTGSSNLTYTISIWHGWSGNKPVELIYNYNGSVNWDSENAYWDSENLRDGGWAYISFVEDKIMLNRGDEYYIEINYNGNGYIYPFDNGLNSESIADGKSYFRTNQDGTCISLNSIMSQGELIAENGDWNIRAVLSGSNEMLSSEFDFVPQKHMIFSNYPNPFNPSTMLPLYLASSSHVKYNVFDLQGRQIEQKDFPFLKAGHHEFSLNMNQFSSGIYFYQINIDDQEYLPKKMMLVK